MYETSITIAGIGIDLHTPLSPAELGIEERLEPFVGDAGEGALRASLSWEEAETLPEITGELAYDPGAIWRMYRSGPRYYADFDYTGLGALANVRGVLQTNMDWDKAWLWELRRGPNWISLMHLGAAELLFRTRLLYAGGLVFHASAVDDNGRGIVFAGPTGAGKSTQADLWSGLAGVKRIADDGVVVRATNSAVMCYDMPWRSDKLASHNHKAPLGTIILLEQAPENELRLLSPSIAAPMLLVRTFLPYWDKSLMQRAVANLDTIVARVPIYHLRCRPEKAVIPLVRSALG